MLSIYIYIFIYRYIYIYIFKYLYIYIFFFVYFCLCIYIYIHQIQIAWRTTPAAPHSGSQGSSSGGGSRMKSSPTGKRGHATVRGRDQRLQHRPSAPQTAAWHSAQRHHHAVGPRWTHLMSFHSWHKPLRYRKGGRQKTGRTSFALVVKVTRQKIMVCLQTTTRT